MEGADPAMVEEAQRRIGHLALILYDRKEG